MIISDIRRQSREQLRNFTGIYQLFLVPVILSIFSISLSLRETFLTLDGVKIAASASFFSLFIQILLTLFLLSASFALLDCLRKKRDSLSFTDNTLAFSSPILWKLVTTLLVRWLYIFLWSLIWIAGLIILSLGVMQLMASSKLTGNILAAFLIALGALIYVIGLGIVINKRYAYSMAEYLLYDCLTKNSYTSPTKLLAKSSQLTKGFKWKLFLLELSFIGWYILTALTMGLLYFYVLPYQTTAKLIYYQELLNKRS